MEQSSSVWAIGQSPSRKSVASLPYPNSSIWQQVLYKLGPTTFNFITWLREPFSHKSSSMGLIQCLLRLIDKQRELKESIITPQLYLAFFNLETYPCLFTIISWQDVYILASDVIPKGPSNTNMHLALICYLFSLSPLLSNINVNKGSGSHFPWDHTVF